MLKFNKLNKKKLERIFVGKNIMQYIVVLIVKKIYQNIKLTIFIIDKMEDRKNNNYVTYGIGNMVK